MKKKYHEKKYLGSSLQSNIISSLFNLPDASLSMIAKTDSRSAKARSFLILAVETEPGKSKESPFWAFIPKKNKFFLQIAPCCNVQMCKT